jgi:hypothetical protein
VARDATGGVGGAEAGAMNNAHGIVAGGCTTPPGQPGAFGPKRKLTKQDAERLVARVRHVAGWTGRTLRRVLRKPRPSAL